ncbi:MAG: 5'/3'-nucleotidase SurE, partial [Planctomycetaceae bacterium]|nr:5'/3'-nucleotidase SurE [Planctomycetaceae bacterium]
MNILLVNDDGVYAPGLAEMETALKPFGNVYTVAPSREQSGVAHTITFLTPLMMKQITVNGHFHPWAVDGSPADCVKIGIAEVMPERPDAVVSGINYGLNTGINILYSGTVNAAAEGVLYGIPSFAVSVERGR